MTAFEEKVWNLCKQIPRGKVSTYSALARVLGNSKKARAVGNALNRNPFSPKVPCHRVIKADGCVEGFARGKKKKIELLRKEGILVKNEKIDLEEYFYGFD